MEEYSPIDVRERHLNTLRLPELQNIAKAIGVKYIKRYRKADLIREIIEVEIKIKKEKENKKIAEIFPFDDDIIAKPKKKRIKKIQCEICGKIIKKLQ